MKLARKLPFMGKISQLTATIRERQHVSLGEACAILNVDPDSIKRRYAPVIVDLCADIRWDGKMFETILESKNLTDQAQRPFTDYLREKSSALRRGP